MKTFKLFKWCVAIGILLGIALKLNDFVRVKLFRCGFNEIRVCTPIEYITELPIWILITTTITIIIVFGLRFLFKKRKGEKKIFKKIAIKKHIDKLKEKAKKRKESKKQDKKSEKPKKEEKTEKKNKEEPEEEDDEEVIKI